MSAATEQNGQIVSEEVIATTVDQKPVAKVIEKGTTTTDG